MILAQFDGTRWLAVLLSADGQPEKLRDRHPTTAPSEKPAAKPPPSPSRKRETKD